MWKRCINKSSLDEFFDILKTNPAYKDYARENIDKMRGNKGGTFFIYDDGNFQMVLSFQYTYSTRMWRICHNIATGRFDPLEAAKITFRKIREFMDERKCTDFYAYLNDRYTPARLQQMFDFYPKITWELTSETIENGYRHWVWHRDPLRKGEDEQWLT